MRISYWPLPLSKNGFGGFPDRAVINSRRKKILEDAGHLKWVINNEIIPVVQQTEFSDTKAWTWKGYFRWLWTYLNLHNAWKDEVTEWQDARDLRIVELEHQVSTQAEQILALQAA